MLNLIGGVNISYYFRTENKRLRDRESEIRMKNEF